MGQQVPRTDWMNDPKNIAIGLLLVTTLLFGSTIARHQLSGVLASRAGSGDGEPVAVLDVVLDREGLGYLDFLLDRPAGDSRVGEVLGLDAATTRPAVGGVWRWEGASVLRFEPSGGFDMAMRYEVSLVGDRLLPEGYYLDGERTFEVITDQFQVERIDLYQEPTPDGQALQIRGTARFNYDVDPEVAASRMRLIDPLRGAEPVPLLFETYYANRVINFRSEPLRKERSERVLQLTVDRTLTPAAGNVPLTADFVTETTLGSSENLAIWDVVPSPGDPESRLRLRLSSQVEPEVAARFVVVEPEVPYRVSAERNQLTLTGEFRPGSDYTLRVSAGLPARDRAVLREEFVANVRVPDLEPGIDFAAQGMFLAARGSRALAVESVNVDRATLLVERVYRNNLFYLFDSYGWMVWDADTYSGSAVSHALGGRVAEVPLRLGGQRNRRRSQPVDLGDYIDPDVPGLYRTVLERRGSYQATQRWVLVTDLGIVAKRGERDFLVWVSSFDNLRPVAGARVTLLSDQNQPIATGATDGRGVWHGRDLAALADQRPYMVMVERGNDFSFLLLDAMGVDTTGLDVGGSASSAVGYQAFAYGERDIYRPGETVEGVAIVRDRDLGAPPPMPLLARHIDPTGMERSTFRIDLDADGTAPFELDVPGYARTGSHVLEIEAGNRVIGRYLFQVEEFVPDRIRVAIDSDAAPPGPGDDLEFAVESAYLFGPPASGLAVDARVRLEPATFAPDGFENYSFQSPQRSYPGSEVFEQQGVLDDDGGLSIQASMPQGLRVPSSLRAVITARVQEQGGRGVSARHSVAVHPYPYYLGLRRASSGYAEPGQAERFEFVAVDAQGQSASAGALRAELYKDEWQTVLRRTPSGAFRYESTRDARMIASFDIAGGERAGDFSLTPEQFGAYRAVLTDPVAGSSAEVQFTASGFGFSPWAIANPARIELELDRDEYQPGETARVQVRAPFSGRLMLTVETGGVQDVQVMELPGNTATISVPVRGAYRPNAYVTATVVRAAGDLQPGSVGRAFGALPLPVDRAANRMPVTVSHPEQVRPGNQIAIDVSAAPGAQLTVAAVDEGILQLIAQRTPDPFEFFYRRLALGVSSFDTFSLLFPEVLAAQAVGGGALADAMSQFASSAGIRRVEPVALWSGVVRADGRGTARVTFDVPDFQGALRVVAVAYRDRRFGGAESSLVVRDPIVLLPTVPRFLSFEETVRLPVSVRNDTGRAGSIQVDLRAELPDAEPLVLGQSVDVPDGDERVVYFDLVTGATAGVADLQLTASGLGESTVASASIPMRPDLPARTAESVGPVTAGGAALPQPDVSELRPGATRTLRVSATPMVQLAGRLDYLVRYPYGCLEQVTSGAFPLVYLGELAASTAPDLFAGTDGPAVMVQQAIGKLGTFQIFSGGFSLWPGSSDMDPWASVYATHFLVEARRAGFLVPDYLYDRALQFVRNEVRTQPDYVHDELQRIVYSLFVMARAATPDVGSMDFVRQQHSDALGAESRALLGAAYAALGNAPAANEMIAGVETVATVARQSGGNFNSPIRNRALVLLALLDAAPESAWVTEVARRLAREAAAADPWNTQESSFALLALGQYFAQESAATEISGRAFAGDRLLGAFDRAGASFPEVAGTEPLRIEMDPGYQGGAFYSLRTRGVPTDAAYRAEQQGLQVRRTFLSRAGQPADLDNVSQGDLLVVRVQVRSTSGALENVVIESLLPAGLEIENARLASTETLPWVRDASFVADHVDLRDDRVLLFGSLPDGDWQTAYAVLRAVTPGTFRLPPVQVEAMYEPNLRASSERGSLTVVR